MSKAIIGSSFILSAVALFIAHYYIAALLASGHGSDSIPAGEYGYILEGSMPNTLFITSIILFSLGMVLSIWSIVEKPKENLKPL
ncbi:hypothetical protein JCM19046_2622 [Bacillus sp. JCM 19046]|nr:hypothetical protein JCM19045_784 [Bacillus sp. JCM 19045]GAF18071.1 hypothetical protein JCM19046_2622 [Bacillus sp. JCM 19046]